jgi:hypothetical protein
MGQVSALAERWRISVCRTIFVKIFHLRTGFFTSIVMTTQQKQQSFFAGAP